jgi:hypothetical protein
MPFLRKYTGPLKTAARKRLSAIAIAVDAYFDAYFNYVTMLLHGDGTNGAQNNTFIDSSSNAFSITRNGNTTQGSFSPYGPNWSNNFNGSSSLSLATATALGTGNATVEFWFYPTDISATYYALYDGRSTVNTNTGLGIFQYGQTIEIYGNGLKVSSAASAFTANTWTHFAVVRTSGTCQIYINGVASGSSASYSDNFTSTARKIGQGTNGSNTYTGYISNLREVTSALYSGTFTPSTTPLTAISGTSLLTCQSNRFIDNSSNAYAITPNGTPSVQRFNPFGTATAYSTSVIGGSGYFDGSGDYLSLASNAAFGFGTGDFTVEFWLYVNSFTTYQTVVATRESGSPNDKWSIAYASDGSVYLYSDTFFGQSTLSAIKTGTWTHVAIVRASSSIKTYVNGTQSGSTSSNTQNFATSALGVGAAPAGTEPMNGYISNLRLVKGTAVYTANFTPPTSPVTAITNTSLLTNFTNGAIFDNAMMNNLETVGNAQISTSVKKYGTGSLAFDGTGDYLVSNVASSDLYAFGTGDFTIEFWLYQNSMSGLQVFYDGRPTSAEGAQPTIYTNSFGTLFYYTAGNRITGSSLSTNTWYHIAVSRSGSSTKMFVDGTQVGSTYTDATNYVNPASRPVIGADGYILGTNAMNGYIDDLRITKGYARYTTTFTPPTAAFDTISAP